MRFLLAILGIIVGLSAAPAAAEVVGRTSVIDGDTIEIHGQRIRLHGIDAPESGQNCHARAVYHTSAQDQLWSCGQQAALALDAKIAGRPVSCEEKDQDRYGRIVAVCRVAGEDLNAWLVAEGWALVYRQYSTAYVDQEERARAAGIGVWRGEFVPPWEWRRGKRLAIEAAREDRTPAAASAPSTTTPAASTGCLIKGNVSSKGERIYHVPGGQYYD